MISKNLFWQFFVVLLFPLISECQTAVSGERAGEVKPQLVRGPYLQMATSGSMVIRWRTNGTTRSRVRFGTEAGRLDRWADDSLWVTEHQVKLRGLKPQTRYYYAIGGFDDTLQGDSGNYFFTLQVAGEKGVYRIGVFGDCGNNSVNEREVRDQLVKFLGGNYMDAWILLGDNAYENGKDDEFQSGFFNIYKDVFLKKYPLFPAPGNHEYHAERNLILTQETHDIAYYRDFSMPVNGEAGGVPSRSQAFYSYDIGNIHFLSLDSYGMEERKYRLSDTTGPQAEWVKRDLEANKNKGWIIAYWHHAPYTMGNHNSDKETELVKIRENFLPILERYGVDLVVCGHSHDYERSRLMEGHYGMESSFNASLNNLSTSSGRNDGSVDSAPYVKDGSNRGTVYVVSGSAGQLGGVQPSFPHDAMYFSDAIHGGADMIEVRGTRLDFTWICADGVIRDHFTIVKNVNHLK